MAAFRNAVVEPSSMTLRLLVLDGGGVIPTAPKFHLWQILAGDVRKHLRVHATANDIRRHGERVDLSRFARVDVAHLPNPVLVV